MTRLAVLEALADDRVGVLSRQQLGNQLDTLRDDGLVDVDGGNVRLRDHARVDVERQVADYLRKRMLVTSRQTRTHGEVLETFDRYCRYELDDVDVVASQSTRLALRWRREQAVIELREGHLGWDHLAGTDPLLLVTELDTSVVDLLLDDPWLRGRIAVYDLGQRQKANVVRCPVFVYFEWFLRECYGIKALAAPEFTAGLVERGVISTGMG